MPGEPVYVGHAITINRPPEELYRYWRRLENLPQFMRHLEAVIVVDDRRSHWFAKAPGGRSVEWHAEITEDRPNELIAWRSLPGSDVMNRGTVRFDRPAAEVGRTIMEEGLEHHFALAYGDHKPALKAIAARWNLPVLELA